MKDKPTVASKVGNHLDNELHQGVGEVASRIAREYLRRVRFHASTFYFRHISSRERHSALVRSLSRLLKRVNEKHRRLTASRPGRSIGIIRPETRQIYVSLTSKCNFGCKGCLYGRSFLPGEQLKSATVYRLIDDSRELHIPFVIFYGGEPLLHPDLVDLVEYTCRKGIVPGLVTNGLLLTPAKMAALYHAGLRNISISIYGVGPDYDVYVNRARSFSRLEENIRVVKAEYPDVRVSLGWLLMKPTCNLASVHQIWDFAKRNAMPVSISLVHYDFPYFSEGHDQELQLFEEDRHRIDAVVKELIHLKKQQPDLLRNSVTGLRSIPDWLILKEKMRVPCNMYDNLWVGPDGTVKVCQKNVVLGNVNDGRLREMLHTGRHAKSAQACLELQCSNCHVNFDRRTCEDTVSREKYCSDYA